MWMTWSPSWATFSWFGVAPKPTYDQATSRWMAIHTKRWWFFSLTQPSTHSGHQLSWSCKSDNGFTNPPNLGEAWRWWRRGWGFGTHHHRRRPSSFVSVIPTMRILRSSLHGNKASIVIYVVPREMFKWCVAISVWWGARKWNKWRWSGPCTIGT